MGNTQCGTKRPPLYEEAGPLEVRSFDVTVPEGVVEGAVLRFRTAAGPYALLIPPGVSPGRKLQVSVTVPSGFDKPLVVQGLTVNGVPVSSRIDEACSPTSEQSGTLTTSGGNVFGAVRGLGQAADRKISEAANKCVGFGQEVVQVYLKEDEPAPIVGNPRWINGRMSIQPKDTSAFAQLRSEQGQLRAASEPASRAQV